jgi:hypothetical protein
MALRSGVGKRAKVRVIRHRKSLRFPDRTGGCATTEASTGSLFPTWRQSQLTNLQRPPKPLLLIGPEGIPADPANPLLLMELVYFLS